MALELEHRLVLLVYSADAKGKSTFRAKLTGWMFLD